MAVDARRRGVRAFVTHVSIYDVLTIRNEQECITITASTETTFNEPRRDAELATKDEQRLWPRPHFVGEYDERFQEEVC